jgi:7-cyano-7-deazaguanine synthase
MDSVALAFWKRPEFAYTVDYGQLAAAGEVRAAAVVAAELGISHRIIRVDCRSLGSGDMAGEPPSAAAPVSEWWPFRNQLILTLAGARALEDRVYELMIGAVRTDGRHADGRLDFFTRADALFSMQEGGLRIRAPAIAMNTVELVRTASIPHGLLAWSHSCHVATHACGTCRGCIKHAETMKILGRDDY